MRRCASLFAMQRISWMDQRMSGGPHKYRLLVRRRIGAMADCGHLGKGEHDERNMAAPAMPGAGLVVIEPKLIFAVSKLSSMTQRWPSTPTKVAMSVPAGHQVQKKASRRRRYAGGSEEASSALASIRMSLA
jgi:hypothetical protein